RTTCASPGTSSGVRRRDLEVDLGRAEEATAVSSHDDAASGRDPAGHAQGGVRTVSELRRDVEGRRQINARNADRGNGLVEPSRTKAETGRTHAADPRVAESEELPACRIVSGVSPNVRDVEHSELAQRPEVLRGQSRADEPVGIRPRPR